MKVILYVKIACEPAGSDAQPLAFVYDTIINSDVVVTLGILGTISKPIAVIWRLC